MTQQGPNVLQGRREAQSLEKIVSHLLEECRMVLPGIQAMLGFQFIAVFNTGFSQQLSPGEQDAHLVSVGLMALSIGALLTPAAYHRIAETHSISDTLINLASCLLSVGMFLLMVAMCIDLYLIARIISHGVLPAAIVAGSVAVILGALWFVFPLIMRERRKLPASPTHLP